LGSGQLGAVVAPTVGKINFWHPQSVPQVEPRARAWRARAKWYGTALD
jgi:hypothetical protein